MAIITLTLEQREKFNKYFAEQYQRNVAMSIFASIKYWQDKEIGFLRFSLDKLYSKYKNKFYLTLSNFKKIANKLVSLGLLKTMNKGRLKFYGTVDCKSDNEIREENKKLREENDNLKVEMEILKEKLNDVDRLKEELEELKKQLKGDTLSEEKEVTKIEEEKKENLSYEYREVSQDIVIQTAYDMMKEVGIEDGSTPFRQVIESLYIKTDREPIHNKGLTNYIKKVIHNKVFNQKTFKQSLIEERKSIRPLRFNNFKGRNYTYEQMQKIERQLLGWE